MFPVLYPGQQLVYAGYLEAHRDAPHAAGQRRYRNVVINLPPRHVKSALASVLYPAWRLGCDPTVKFICISYGDNLAHDLTAQTRKIMRSPLYKQFFPSTVLDKSAVDHIRMTMGGYRYATAVGSDITGFGADEIIIDDPVQPEDALSERLKQQLRDWVNSSVYTRLANKLNREWASSNVRAHAVTQYYDATQIDFVRILKGQGFTLSEIGTHAGLDDTSLMLALDPSLVREDRLSNGSKFGSAEGVYGDPSKASARLGILGVDAIVFQTVAAIKSAVSRR
jgi:Creatinine amidohydrolase